jgi:signal transduction histidine kinase/CheY-like chemotaxis protein/purine-cytosine permease-like protein
MDTAASHAPQRVIKIRRDYNAWVGRETMEDYALRFTPRAFRKWSELRVANTAFGAASFLILEAIGATLLVQHGFVNAALAILATGLVIFLAGLPVSVYAARHGVDMDLLTRGAGFGYLGSTITSLIYASFTFIFFALEAAVMAYALELAFGLPPAWGYLVCALVVIPLVTHGVTTISRLQVWTQPLWLAMLVLPYAFVFHQNPGLLAGLASYGGESGGPAAFGLHAFGAATTVGIALITQMGEQADYLRFMPEKTRANRVRWWAGVLIGGPGWVLPGVLKMLGGALLAYLAISHMVPVERAVDPNQMYLVAYEHVFPHYGWAVAATALFVVVSQLKINVTNAYAGSLAWSNFFSRLTHSHPGRVVWVVFNTLIALMLMELGVFRAMGQVLGVYSNIAIAWMMAVVADLVVNKPLGLSPPGIEFKRAHLYDVNPVGVGAMGIASALSITAHLGAFGPLAQAFSALIALVTAFVASPLIAWATQGRYYLARHPHPDPLPQAGEGVELLPFPLGEGRGEGPAGTRLARCCICERDYEREDIAHCPAYRGPICSLCCTLDARCEDQCKPHARLASQWSALLRRLLPERVWPSLDSGLAHYLLLMLIVAPALAGLLWLFGRQGYANTYAVLLLVSGVAAWWLVLAHKSRQVAQEESMRQTQALNEQARVLGREIDSHRRTDQQLQQARQESERARRSADNANQAKSRYITAISHELRTPLNSILGYAQLLADDEGVPPRHRRAVQVIRRGGDHLLSLIEDTLDIARIEGGKLKLDNRPMRFADCVHEIARLFELQASAKGIGFETRIAGTLPVAVRADEKRLRQILINVIGNAVKFTGTGRVVLRASHAREIARFEIEDTGPGMSEADMERAFEPFQRGSAAGSTAAGGSGLGLTIANMLTALMGGEMTVRSAPGAGTTFTIRLFVPQVGAERLAELPLISKIGPTGYAGARRRILVVDNEEVDRGLLASLLQPLGFGLLQAGSGEEALDRLRAGARPDAVFMDLAMPGIDGWETIRRIRAEGLAQGVPLAVVSANAFDRGLDNDAGIAAGDFIVKPVRLAELLGWLEDRLGLTWLEGEPAAPEAARTAGAVADAAAQAAGSGVAMPLEPPAAVHLHALAEAVQLGHLRGVRRCLEHIEAEQPACAGFVERMRALAGEFQFETMTRLIEEGLRRDAAAR